MTDPTASMAREVTRATSIVALLTTHTHLLHHLNDFFVRSSWQGVPEAWRKFLLSLSTEDLAALPSRMPRGAPASLTSFIADAAALALPRNPPQPGLHWAAAGPATLSLSIVVSSAAAYTGHYDLWKGMDAKKAHEVAAMAPQVGAHALATGCRRVVDVGCGQGYVDRLLAAQGLRVLGVDSQAHNVAAARAAARAAPLAQQFVTEQLRTDASAPQRVGELIAAAWPPECVACEERGDEAREQEQEQEQDEEDGRVLVCALHACGDLTPTRRHR